MPQQLSLEEILGNWGRAIAAKERKRAERAARRQPSPRPVRVLVTTQPVVAPPRPAYDPMAPSLAEVQATYDHLLAEWDRATELSSPRANGLQMELQAARFQLGVAAYRAASRGE